MKAMVLRAPALLNVILVLVCFAQFMVVLDATVVNLALPSIQNRPGFVGGAPPPSSWSCGRDVVNVALPSIQNDLGLSEAGPHRRSCVA